MEHDLPSALKKLIDRASLEIREGSNVDAFLAGGTATWMHLLRAGPDLAAAARHSEDADIEFSRPLNLAGDIVVHYADPEGRERFLALDRTYTAAIGLRHPDYRQRARPLFESDNGRIHLHLLDPMDLAVTKVGRYEDHDREDIRLLARAGLLDAEGFRQHALEALEYLATDPGMVRIHIDEAVAMIRDAGD